jgi:hypothetical protein
MCCRPASLVELQKSEPKRLKSLSRAQNRALRETVDLPRDSGVALLRPRLPGLFDLYRCEAPSKA